MNKERKYILIGGAILLLIGAIYRFFPEIEAFQPSGEEIVLKQKKLIKYRQTVQERSQTDAKLIALNRSLERSEAGLLNGETPALAAVDIQNILNQIASKSKVEVKAMRVLEPAEPEDGPPVKAQFLRIPVQITVNSTIRQFKEILYGIETSSKLLRITEMKITAGRSKPAEQIYSSLVVEGFMNYKGTPKK
ncbi:MAG: hypothetical protein BWK80_20500 [Desulfobacteraceae bacterium IS3]|nr:MAG: hypothetical protein BWK80_20500 [Desulfobacteraceae bacterium IS3]